MTKEQELMIFLHDKVFDPILNSKSASKSVKKRRQSYYCKNEQIEC